MKRFVFTFEPDEHNELKEGDFAYDPNFGIGRVVTYHDELCFQSIQIKNKGSITAPVSRNIDDKRPYRIVSIIEKHQS